MATRILTSIGLSLAGACILAASDSYVFQQSIGGPPAVGEPRSLTVDAQGAIYVADRGNSRILKITPDGRMAAVVSNTDPLAHPTAVTLDAKGTLLAVDEAVVAVHSFSSTGGHMATSDVAATGGWGASAPGGIVADEEGNSYVSDQMANVVYKYSPTGKVIQTIGSKGSEPGQFMGPRGIALDASGNLYVADEFNNRIQKFDSKGQFIASSNEKGLGATVKGGLGPMSVAVDSKGNMWIAAHTNFAVYKLNPNFQVIVHMEAFGRRDGELAGPIAVSVDKQDNVYVLDNTRRIQKFSPIGSFLWKYAFPEAGPGELSAPTGVAADKQGNIYVSDTANFRIQKFDREGKYLLSFGQFGQGDGDCNGCESIAIDKFNNVYSVDHYNHRVQKFDSNGKFILKFGRFGSGPGEFVRTKVVATNPAGDTIYVNDWHNNRVQKFDLQGNFIAAMGDSGDFKTRPMGPTGLAVDAAGNVYASSWYNNVVQKYDATGHYVKSIGKPGNGDGEFSGPARLAIDNQGRLVAVDWGNSRVQIFDADGNFLTKFGSMGTGKGQFNQPVGVAVDPNGRIMVGDASNARVQIFVPTVSAAGPTVPAVRPNNPKALLAPADSKTTPADSGIFGVVALYDIEEGKSGEFEAALNETSKPMWSSKELVNDRVLKNIDGLTLQYATYSKFSSEETSRKFQAERSAAVAAFCRRPPEVHFTRVTNAYSVEQVSDSPTGLEFGMGKTGQIAHLGLFIPFPSYEKQYQGVLQDTKVLTRAKHPHGYIGEDIGVETEAPEPMAQTPYSPKAPERAAMSFNYGEYNTMEDAENSYISRLQTRDPKLVTMERIFFSSLQVPTRFYIFQVITNHSRGGTDGSLLQASLR